MTTLSDFLIVDNVDYPQAAHINQLRATSLRTEYANTETISATKELADGDTPFQIITCSAANRTVELPPEATTNHPFIIYNTTPSSDGYTIAVKDDSGATTYVTLTADQYALFAQVNGEGWKMLSSQTPTIADFTNATHDHSNAAGGGYLTRGYVLTAYANSFSPVDATTYYFGSFIVAPGTTADTKRVYVPKAGTVTRAHIRVHNNGGTQGSNETSTMSFRLNNTTDTSLTTSFDVNDASGASSFFNVTGLSVAVIAGDYFEIKWVTPTWSTNPTAVLIQVDLFVE